jgi:hypothetical protein
MRHSASLSETADSARSILAVNFRFPSRKASIEPFSHLTSSPTTQANMLTALPFIAAFVVAGVSATCYTQDGTPEDSIYTSCNQNVEFSMCCRTQEVNGDPADTCLPNGLCMNNQGVNKTTYWRESCTDPTWKSPYCLKAFNPCTAVSKFQLFKCLES